MTIGPTGPKTDYISHAKKVKDIPLEPHWVILTEETVTTWSGYKEDNGSSETVMRYHVFKDEETWKDAIRRIEESKLKSTSYTARDEKYIAFHVDMHVETRVEIDVKIGKFRAR